MTRLAKLAAVAFAMTASAPALAGTFTVVNTNGRYYVERVWSAPSVTNWNYSALRMVYSIAPRTTSAFDLPSSYCLHDIKIRFSDGYEQKFYKVDVCRGDRVIAS
jgi:hypothetical protein